jgi:hypothetical protein
VTKKDLIEQELPADKELLAAFTKKHPSILEDFRKSAAATIRALPNSDFEAIDVNQLIDHLIAKLRSVKTGREEAAAYHTLMIGILEFIFYPSLIHPVKEHEIDDGRKRIDITFDNGAPRDGFFYRLQHAFDIPCQYIIFECKNYTEDVANAELDQLTGRLSPNRGKFGVIVCRDIEDEPLFIQRCADSYKAQRGLIVPLTDADIVKILEARKVGTMHLEDEILSDKSRRVMNI